MVNPLEAGESSANRKRNSSWKSCSDMLAEVLLMYMEAREKGIWEG